MKEKINHNVPLSADGRERGNMEIAPKSKIKLNNQKRVVLFYLERVANERYL
jgi:hypothetical protein